MSIRELKLYAADRLHGMGYNLMPLKPKAKTPFFSEWKIRQEQRMSRVELRSVFLRHDCNLGVIMGELEETGVNVLGIDADSDAGISYVRKHFPPSNTITRTAKGEHHKFQLPQGVRPVNSTRWNGQDIDIRAHGSYLVAPPSEHETGFVYQHIQGPKPATDLEYFDPDLLKSVQPVYEPKALTNPFVDSLRRYIFHIDSIQGRGGDRAAFRVACKIVSVVEDFNEAVGLMMEWNALKAVPPWSEKEICHKIRSAMKYVLT